MRIHNMFLFHNDYKKWCHNADLANKQPVHAVQIKMDVTIPFLRISHAQSCVQVRKLQVGDSSGVQQLQLALERIQSSSSSSVHQAHLPNPQDTAAALSSSSSPGHSPHRYELHAESPAHEGQTSSSSPQNPFAEATRSHIFQQTADPWDPWAEPSHQQSSSSPHYRPGSSDGDWDEQHQHADQPDDHPSAHHHSQIPQPDHHAEDEQTTSDSRAVSGKGQSPRQDPYSSAAEGDDPGHDRNPREASAMAEAQHRVDQLAGLAASHAEVQETLAREADLGYAWGLMGGYTQHLQQQVMCCHPPQSAALSPPLPQPPFCPSSCSPCSQ